MVGHADLEHRIAHPPRHCRLSLFEGFEISLAQTIGTSLDKVGVDICFSVVMAIAVPAHRVPKIVSPDERIPVHTGELRALVRVTQHQVFQLAPSYRHLQRLRHGTGKVKKRRDDEIWSCARGRFKRPQSLSQ